MPASFTPEKSIQVLNQQITKGKELLKNIPVDSNKYDAWKTVTKNFLMKAFGIASPNISNVMDVGKYGSFPLEAGPSYWENKRAKNLEKQISLLCGLIEVLESETSSGDDKNPKEKNIYLVIKNQYF